MKTALVIEDNEDNMELITFILQGGGYDTLWAETGLKGVDMALDGTPDFILLDIQLPDISGFEVLNRIRASEGGMEIPIIAVTSYAMAGDRERLITAGCDGYIEKPIDPARFINQVQTILESD
jgi:CheY-like chemotaxis protein